ncbi:hypothetical protein [Bradyrhizobium sp. WSM1743]|uniref:hypothetical protein n=1 Tax=Bradyrhizobium sp. WSM1743 TaxID=318996 RepID=UPI000422C302|nr:hypothetical protein [Bradyrhizobium sp. WSM1743]
MRTGSRQHLDSGSTENRTYLESLIREDFERCHPRRDAGRSQLARQIREITPDFPVLYMTSASAPDWESQGVDGCVLIQKPFAPAQLAAAISQLLDGPSPA